MPLLTARKATGSEGERGGRHRFKRAVRSRRARIGRSKSRARASLSIVAEVDRRCRAQRSVRSQFHPIWGANRDGSLAHSQQASAKSVARWLRAK